MKRALWLVAVAALLVAAPATADQRTALADLEDEVMCPVCGTLLELAEAPQANRQRALIKSMIARGATKAEIKDELVAEYGPQVLALPRGSGFELSAYLVPAAAFVVAVLALAVGVRRWRRASETAAAGPNGPTDEESKQLDADLARYDL